MLGVIAFKEQLSNARSVCPKNNAVGQLYAGPDLPIGYIGRRLGPQDPRGLQQTVVAYAYSQLPVYD